MPAESRGRRVGVLARVRPSIASTRSAARSGADRRPVGRRAVRMHGRQRRVEARSAAASPACCAHTPPSQPASTSPVPAVASAALPVGLMKGTRPGAAITVPEPFSTTMQPSRPAISRAAARRSACTRAGVAAEQPRGFERMRRQHRRRAAAGAGGERSRSAGSRATALSASASSTSAAPAVEQPRQRGGDRLAAAAAADDGRCAAERLVVDSRHQSSRHISSGRDVDRDRHRVEQVQPDAAGACRMRRAGGEQRAAGHAGRAADHRHVAVAALVRAWRRRGRTPATRAVPVSQASGVRADRRDAEVVEPDLAGQLAAAAGVQAGLGGEQGEGVAGADAARRRAVGGASPAGWPVSASSPEGRSTASTGQGRAFSASIRRRDGTAWRAADAEAEQGVDGEVVGAERGRGGDVRVRVESAGTPSSSASPTAVAATTATPASHARSKASRASGGSRAAACEGHRRRSCRRAAGGSPPRSRRRRCCRGRRRSRPGARAARRPARGCATAVPARRISVCGGRPACASPLDGAAGRGAVQRQVVVGRSGDVACGMKTKRASPVLTAARRPSALLVLLAAEQQLARLVVGERLARVGQHLDAALDRRAGGDLVEPALQVRIVVPVDALVLPRAQPREDGDVGDGVLGPGDVACSWPAAGPSRRRAASPRWCSGRPRSRSSRARRCGSGAPGPSIGPTPPIWNISHCSTSYLPRTSCGQERAGLAGQVEQDRARLEQRDRLAVGPVRVDDGRDLVVRADLQEVGRELVAGADVDRDAPGTAGRTPPASRGPCGRWASAQE